MRLISFELPPGGEQPKKKCDSAKKTAMTDVFITDPTSKFHRKTTKNHLFSILLLKFTKFGFSVKLGEKFRLNVDCPLLGGFIPLSSLKR